MLERIRAFFGRNAAPEKRPDSARLAVAALLVEAARADEHYDEREKRLIDASLVDFFGVTDDEATALRAEAETAQNAANDLHRFTKIAKALAAADKVRLVEILWTIVLSDDRRDPHEDAMIRRVCGLIYVSDPESGAARRRAAQGLAAAGGARL
ncbi:MAG: TerB family tellurite resistance protein [Parvularculaceae bacterium]